MALQICIAHTGERLQCDDASLPPTTLDAMKSWLQDITQIPVQDQILLNGKGKALKNQALLAENEIFLYDRVLFTRSTTKNDIALLPVPSPLQPADFPTDLADQNSLRAWQSLFKKRRDWAKSLSDHCREASVEAEDCLRQKAVVDLAARIATLNLESRLKTLEKKYSDAGEGFAELEKDVKGGLKENNGGLDWLGTISAKPGFGAFFRGRSSSGSKSKHDSTGGSCTLASFVDAKGLQSALTLCRSTLNDVDKRLGSAGQSLVDIQSRFDNLSAATNLTQSRSAREDPEEPVKLMHEIDVTVNKVGSDCERVASFLIDDTKAPAAASKIALLHTRNFLPAVKEYAIEMGDLLRDAVEQKNTATLRLLENLQAIASLEAVVASTTKNVTNLQILPEDGQDAIDYVAMVAQMPWNYGSLLVEAVRRREWAEKMRRDSSTLAEELAGYQDEEYKRRKKWLKSMDHFLQDAVQGTVMGFEINLQGEDQEWPEVDRQDVDTYIDGLQKVDGMTDVVESLLVLIRELDKPTRQQVKRAKTFKMGSVHEAGFGKGSLLLRGEDEGRILREANLKLEEELKGHRSRIRKLEDLLHRQSHVGRLSVVPGTPSSGYFPDLAAPATERVERPALSPRAADTASRRSSISSRRFSANMQNVDDKLLNRRLVQLETELNAEKEARASLAKDLLARNEADEDAKRQIQESNSTKKDLMKNMEAQQREFANERRAMEEEMNKYKIRIEEVEDELDRILGSRDNERTGTAEKMQALVADYDQMKRDAASDLRKVEDGLRHREEADRERRATLVNMFTSLAANEQPPEDPVKLTTGLEILVQRSVDHARELAQALAFAKSENESLQAMLERQRSDTVTLETSLKQSESQAVAAAAELELEKSKAKSLQQHLDEATSLLKQLRSQFADGETGSESLRKQLAMEEEKVIRLTNELTETKSHLNSLDVELLSLQSKYRVSQERREELLARLLHRSTRAKDLSQRLYTQVDRLSRLLDALGFVVTHNQDGQMVIHRASKVGSSAVFNAPDGMASTSAQKLSSPTLASRMLDDLSDLSCILWMEKDSPTDEAAKFEELKEKLNRFDLDTFCETIAKRMRDIEHTARKWQKEARNYRDRAHKYQHEAHGKIAFRAFKEGDLALFLPTRNQATRPWAAFNVGAPHYFLREQDSHRLSSKEWLVARISKVQERTVDMSKAVESARAISGAGLRPGDDPQTDAAGSFEDDNPFELSDGLRWYLLDALEEKPGAPSTPGLGKAVVGGTNVDARGSIRMLKKRPGDAVDEVNRQLSKSLDSRRSSNTSKKSTPGALGLGIGQPGSNEALRPSSKASNQAVQSPQPQDEGQNLTIASPIKAPTVIATAPSPTKSLSSSIRVQASSSRDGIDSPSPVKDRGKTPRGAWDFLGQFDLSLEKGRNK